MTKKKSIDSSIIVGIVILLFIIISFIGVIIFLHYDKIAWDKKYARINTSLDRLIEKYNNEKETLQKQLVELNERADKLSIK